MLARCIGPRVLSAMLCVRFAQSMARHPTQRQAMGRSRGGLTSKKGLSVRLALKAGQAHHNRLAPKLLSRLMSGAMLLANRGYDADWSRAPPRRNRNDALCFSPYLYRARNLVERFFNKIKQCRRV